MISYFQLKLYINAFRSCLKGFKLKKIVVEPKMTQSVEWNEEPIDWFDLTSRRVQKPSLFQNDCSTG